MVKDVNFALNSMLRCFLSIINVILKIFLVGNCLLYVRIFSLLSFAEYLPSNSCGALASYGEHLAELAKNIFKSSPFKSLTSSGFCMRI